MWGYHTARLYREDLLERIRALATEIVGIRRRMAALEAQTQAHKAHIAALLRDIVEVDETYVGANARGITGAELRTKPWSSPQFSALVTFARKSSKAPAKTLFTILFRNTRTPRPRKPPGRLASLPFNRLSR